MHKAIPRTFFGLLLALIFSTFQFMQSKIQEGTFIPIIFQDIWRLGFIFIFSYALEFTTKPVKAEYPKYLLFISPLADTLGIYFLNMGFRVVPPYFVFFMNLMIFPMDSIFQNIFNNEPLPLQQLILFTILVTLVFLNGLFFKEPSDISKDSVIYTPHQYVHGTGYMLLSNFCFLVNIHSQYKVSLGIGVYRYYLYTVPISLILGLVIAMFSYKSISLDEVLYFYESNFKFLILCGVSGALFYMSGSRYISEFGPLYFNIANLPSSSVSGILDMVLFGKKCNSQVQNYFKIGIYLIVIIIGIVMLCINH